MLFQIRDHLLTRQNALGIAYCCLNASLRDIYTCENTVEIAAVAGGNDFKNCNENASATDVNACMNAP